MLGGGVGWWWCVVVFGEVVGDVGELFVGGGAEVECVGWGGWCAGVVLFGWGVGCCGGVWCEGWVVLGYVFEVGDGLGVGFLVHGVSLVVVGVMVTVMVGTGVLCPRR